MSTLFSDNFNRADNTDLGANWDAGYTGLGNCQIVSNAVEPVTVGTNTMETQNAASMPNDQWAQMTIVAAAAGTDFELDLVLRCAAPPTRTHIECRATDGTPGFTSRIATRVNGTIISSVTENVTTWAPGDVMYAEVVGNLITLKRNGVTLLTLSQTDITSGARSGIRVFNGAGLITDSIIDDFSTGDFPSVGVPFFTQVGAKRI